MVESFEQENHIVAQPSTTATNFQSPARDRSPTRTSLRSTGTPSIRGSHESLKHVAPAHQQGKKPPKARHPTEHIDPAFIETEAYTRKPGIGMVYDWHGHHTKNRSIITARQKHSHEQQVAEAARRASAVELAGIRGWEHWVARKQAEQVQRAAQHQRLLALISPPRRPASSATAAQLARREAQWSAGLTPAEAAAAGPLGLLGRTKVIKRPGHIANL